FPLRMEASGECDKENTHLTDESQEEFVTPDTKPTIIVEKIPDDPILSSPIIYSQGAASTATAGTSADDSDDDDLLEAEEVGDGAKRGVTCRKEKSLGLLCQRFIEAMKQETAKEDGNGSVHLESVATKMKVEKRRIYDIVNVMEALDAMSKLNKSYYAWHGLNNLPKLMHELQRESIDENLPSKIVQVEQAMCSFTDLSPGAKRKDLVGSMLDPVVLPSGPSTVSSSPLDSPFSSKSYLIAPSSVPSPSTSASMRDPRGTKNSLAMLCRRFIMVLLANPQDRRRVSLDVASTVLIKDTETEGFDPPSRGRCRRLYDIANVLVAMGIIKKVHYLFGTKKIPLFIYSGPEPDEHATLSDEKLEEMMVLPRKAIDDVIREKKTFGKRSKSEACLDDVMRQQRAGKISRMCSPHDSPATAAWKMMALAEAAEKERLLMAYSHSPNTKKRLTQSTSSLVLPPASSSQGWSTSAQSIPTSPLALGAGQFVLPRPQNYAIYRTLSDLSAIGGGSTGNGPSSSFARSPRSSLQPVLSPLSTMNRLPYANISQIMAAAVAADNAGRHQQQVLHQSPKVPARRILTPLQPSITSPRNSGSVTSPKKTPKHSMKYLLKSPGIRRQLNANGETPEKEKVRIGTLEHRDNSRFKIVKKEPGAEELRRAFGVSNNFNQGQNQAGFEAMRRQYGI
ncbi:hypothetical protein PMAYCL1PPCAC_05490, partial [Pristionchus mayeri]